jgi:hypothetical protein
MRRQIGERDREAAHHARAQRAVVGAERGQRTFQQIED